MKIINYFILAFVLLTGFSSCSSTKNHSPTYVNLAHEITAKTAKKLKGQKNLHLKGTGGAMMDDIQMMMMGFDFAKEVNIEEARELLVYSVEEYLSAINGDEKIQPYLHDHPFTAKNVEIVIYFSNPDKSQLPADKIQIASANQGTITYYIHNPIDNNLQIMSRETYKAAQKALSM